MIHEVFDQHTKKHNNSWFSITRLRSDILFYFFFANFEVLHFLAFSEFLSCFSNFDFHFFEIGFKSRSFGGSGDFSLSPSSSPRRDLSNELGLSSGNKKVSTFFLASKQW